MATTTSSKSRSNAPVLPLNFSFTKSLSPSRKFSHSSTSSSSSSSSQPPDPFSSLPSNFASSSSSSMSSSIFHRPSSPTRINVSSPAGNLSPFRISLNRSHSPNSRVSVRDQIVSKSTSVKKRCTCSPTNHPGSFRCSIHRNSADQRNHNGNNGESHSVSCSPGRLNLRRSAMTNSLVRIGTVEGDWVKRALTALIRPSSHQQRRRFDFHRRRSRLSIMSKAGDCDL